LVLYHFLDNELYIDIVGVAILVHRLWLSVTDFQTLPKSALTNLIASSMTGRESFACYRDGDGNVIALDKTGFCVTE
jgi:hypothetical protein